MKLKISLLLACSIQFIQAQMPTETHQQTIIKLNLSSLAVNNINVNAERSINPNKSISIGLNVPLNTKVRFIDSEYLRDNDDSVAKGFGLVSELRFFSKKNDRLNGFYAAPFAHIGQYSLSNVGRRIAIEPDVFSNDITGVLIIQDIKAHLIGIGGKVGMQWIINNKFVIDCGGGIGANLSVVSGLQRIPTNQWLGYLESRFTDTDIVPDYQLNLKVGILL